ncbi:MAG: YdeI/OmpD-associated family protein [Christensenella sp.]|nr:YdeI/OmpD-associated family protein [Christensenella sp.]
MEPSNKANLIEASFQSGARWAAPLSLLRELLLFGGFVEDYKWGKPCYTLNGSNVIILFDFKEACAIGFMKGALMKDEAGILTAPGENSQAMRMVKFQSVDEVRALVPTLRAYIAEAVAIEEAGLEIKFQPAAVAEMPAEFAEVLERDAAAKLAFYSLTPGRQRAYLLYFSDPKQSKTRTARIEKYLPRILNGKGMLDHD